MDSGSAYKWKTPFCKADANEAGKVCEELERTVGLTAETLVDASRPEGTVLHDEFEWNDTTAAELYRRQQARVILGNLIRVETDSQPQTRGFFAVTASKKEANNYYSIVNIMSDEEKRRKLYGIAKRELLAFKVKYQTLKELEKVFKAIDELE